MNAAHAATILADSDNNSSNVLLALVVVVAVVAVISIARSRSGTTTASTPDGLTPGHTTFKLDAAPQRHHVIRTQAWSMT